jgi:hypothetical protein
MAAPFSCDQCEELLPGYILNLLDAEEAAAVAEHLRTCSRCQSSLTTHADVVGRLGEAVRLQDPPDNLQRRLMAAIAAEMAPTDTTLTPSRWWRIARPRWAVAVTVVNAMLFLGAAGWAGWAWYGTSHTRAQLQHMQYQMEQQRQALTLVASPASHWVALNNGGNAHGTLLLQGASENAVLVVEHLPPLPPDRVYQLWLVRDNARDNGGIFQVDQHGFGMLGIRAPYPLMTYRAVGITEEPAGGSPGPTSSRLIGAPLQSR